MKNWQRTIGTLMVGLGSLFGQRTPPEPQVIAQTAPSPRPTGTPTAPKQPKDFPFGPPPPDLPRHDD